MTDAFSREIDLSSIRKIITEIWEGVLGTDVSDIHESFYNLGGSSISAMRINMLILKTFKIEYTMEMYENHATVSAQSSYIYERINGT